MGMRQTVLSALWLSGTRNCVMEGRTGSQQDTTCPPLFLTVRDSVPSMMSFDTLYLHARGVCASLAANIKELSDEERLRGKCNF